MFASIATTRVGLAVGAEIDLMGYMTSRYFGMRAFGTIYSYMFAFFSLSSGLGPFLMGLSFSKTGSYNIALVGFAISLLFASAVILSLGPYRYPISAVDRTAEAAFPAVGT